MHKPDDNSIHSSGETGKVFMRLYTANERRIYGYVASLVPNWSDIDDIIQEVAIVMWDKFDQFEHGTDFVAWALCIARYQVMSYRQKQGAKKRRFCQEALDNIEAVEERDSAYDQLRRDALQECLGKLKEKDRKVLMLRYEMGGTILNVSQRLGFNINTLYKILSRVRIQLLNCVNRRIAGEESL